MKKDNLITNYLKSAGKKYFIVSFLFILLSPVFILSLKPHLDIKYHFLDKEPKVLGESGLALKSLNNEYASVSGKIDMRSIVIHTNLLQTEVKGVLFRLKNSSKNLVFHLRQGELFNQINDLYKSSESGKYTSILIDDSIIDKSEMLKKSYGDEKGLLKIMTFVDNKVFEFSGRIYSSDNILEPFFSYYYRDDADLENYYKKLGEEFKTRPKFEKLFDFSSKIISLNYNLMHIDEKPSIAGLSSTNTPLFLIVIIIFLGGIFYYLQ